MQLLQSFFFFFKLKKSFFRRKKHRYALKRRRGTQKPINHHVLNQYLAKGLGQVDTSQRVKRLIYL